MKPIRDNEDFKEAFRNVKNGPQRFLKKVIFKGVLVLTHFFLTVMGETQVVRDSSHVRVTHGTNQRQQGPQKTLQEYLK